MFSLPAVGFKITSPADQRAFAKKQNNCHFDSINNNNNNHDNNHITFTECCRFTFELEIELLSEESET